MSTATFEEIVRAWLLDYDDRLPNSPKERKRAFLVLLGNLEKYGYGKEELNKGKKEKIVRECVNPNHYSKSKLRTWISMVVKDLEAAIHIRYSDIKIDHDVVTPEMEAKLDNLEKKDLETRALKGNKTENNECDKDNFDQVKDSLDEPINIDLAIKDAVENPNTKLPQTFEITDEFLNDINEPTINWDEDFSKRFGLDDDEQS